LSLARAPLEVAEQLPRELLAPINDQDLGREVEVLLPLLLIFVLDELHVTPDVEHLRDGHDIDLIGRRQCGSDAPLPV